MELGILLVGLPLLFYLVSSFTIPKDSIRQPNDFFIAYKKVGTTPFSNSSIAYAFQIATVYPFLAWAASRMFLVPLLNAAFWGLGIVFFMYCIPKLKEFIGSDLTLHGFLGNKYSSSIRRLTSFLTIVGLLGVAVAEVVWGSQVLLPIIKDKPTLYLVLFSFVFLVLLYISYGGQISSIRTDQLQLIFCYTGVFGLMVYLILIDLVRAPPSTDYMLRLFLILLVVYIPILLFLRKGKFLTAEDEVNKFSRVVTIAANGLLNVFLVLLFIGSLVILTKVRSQANFGELFNLRGFGLTGAISLILLPLCWQFVDMTNWQRILAVQENQVQEYTSYASRIKKGYVLYALESPFTWILFLVLGVVSSNARPEFSGSGDIFTSLPQSLLLSSSGAERALGFLFIASIMAIMLSTVDSILTAAMFAFVYDTFPKTARIIDRKDPAELKQKLGAILSQARLFGACFLVLGIGLFVGFDVLGYGGDRFIGILFAFYTAQLSFFPAVLGAIFLKNPPKNLFVFASILLGALGGVGFGLYATFFNPDYQWHSIILALSLSTIFYLLAWMRERF